MRRHREANWFWVCSTALSIFSIASRSVSSITRTSVPRSDAPGGAMQLDQTLDPTGTKPGSGRDQTSWTSVPSLPPCTMLRSDPGFDMSKTTIGMPLSRQNAMAVASITLRFFVITSR